MDTTLIHDAIAALRQQLDAGTGIDIRPDHGRLRVIMDLLADYEFAYSRKVTILACCILIHLAADRHRELALRDNDALTRGILDGDYLTGLCYRFAAARREWKLLSLLTAFNKKLQLALLKGTPADCFIEELKSDVKAYLDRQSA